MAEKLIKWADAPSEDDLADARQYLILLGLYQVTLSDHPRTTHPAKDLLRAAQLPALPQNNAGVAKWTRRIKAGDTVPPVLLIPGYLPGGLSLAIAEGYHRVCACYLIDEQTPVAGHFLNWS